MIEIIVVYFLCKGLGKIVRAKGRKPLWLQVMLVVSWFGGEFVGAFIGAIGYVVMTGDDTGELHPSVYLFALLGAALGAGFCFLVAYLLPDAAPAYDPYQAAPDFGGMNPSKPRVDSDNPYHPPRS